MSIPFHIAQLRHLYQQMVEGQVKDTAEAARGLLGPAIEELERSFAPKQKPKRAPRPVVRCEKGCGNPAAPEHECPFSSEINDNHTLCTCCPDCRSECADRI